MKTIALNLGSTQIELREDLAKSEAGGRGSRTTRTRNGNNRMSGGHSNSLTGKMEQSTAKLIARHDVDGFVQF
ncbi:hypothetical protein D3C71_1250660 [compost metagenome]